MDSTTLRRSAFIATVRGLMADRTAQCLLLTAVILGYCRIPLSSAHVDDSYYYYQKLTWKQNADVVILGDSRPMVALSPKVMSGDLEGLRIRNFSFSGVGYSDDYLTAAEQVWDRERSSSRIALIGITPRSLRRISQEDNRFTNSLRTYSPQRYWKARWLSWIPHLWPPLDRPFLRGLVQGASRDEFKLYRDSYGWFEPCHQNADLQGTMVYYRRIQTDPICDEIVNRLVKRVRDWTAKGIHVYGFRPPTNPEMEALEDDFAEESFVQAFEAAGGRWIAPPCDDLATYDASHLDIDSVPLFSRRVAQAVAMIEKRGAEERCRDLNHTGPQRQATASLNDRDATAQISQLRKRRMIAADQFTPLPRD